MTTATGTETSEGGLDENTNITAEAPDHEAIAQRAYELYCAWGLEDGNDLAHWFEAERQLKDEQASRGTQTAAA